MKIDWISTPSWNVGNGIGRVLRWVQVLFCLGLAAMVAPAQTKPITFEVASIKPPALDMHKLMAQAVSG